MSKSICNHIITKGKENETGTFCLDCGIKVSDFETRSCGGCNNYIGSFGIGSCSKHSMMVSSMMKVMYKLSKGTCWEKIKK